MNIFFWICWIAELAVVLWWIATDIQQEHMDPNPYSYLSFLYLMTVLLLRLVPGWITVSNIMVIVPAIPLTGLLLIIILHKLSGSKWN